MFPTARHNNRILNFLRGKSCPFRRVFRLFAVALILCFAVKTAPSFAQTTIQAPSILNSVQNISVDSDKNPGTIRAGIANDRKNEKLREEDTAVCYRRWLVPKDRVWDWPLKDGPYVSLKRDRFEQWVDLLQRSEKKRQSKHKKCLTRIFLQAKLEGRQFVDGKGTLDLPDQLSETNEKNPFNNRSSFLSLDPWNLYVKSAMWNDETPALIVRNSDDETSLIIPPDMLKKESGRQIRFSWSMRGRSDSPGRMQFDFSLPESTSFEIQLDLPSYIIPSIPVGIVEKILDTIPESEIVPTEQNELAGEKVDHDDKKNRTGFSRWRLMLRQHAKTTLTLAVDERHSVAQQKTGYQNHLFYNISQHGLDVTSRIQLDQNDPTVNEFYFDIEDPLRLLEIGIGERKIPWTAFKSDLDRTRIHVDMNDIAANENGEITIKAIGPIVENRDWTLPRIEIVSSNVFWNETRYGVVVQKPLLVQNIECDDAMKVLPLTTYEQSDREVFAYRLFQPASSITVNLGLLETKTFLNSFSQIRWSNNEIKSETIVDCNVFDGEMFSLDIPVSEHWTINTIKAVSDDIISSWDIIEDHASANVEKENASLTSRRLVVQFQKPHRSKDGPLRIQVQGRYLSSPHQQFALKNLSPFNFTHQNDQVHLIAIALEPPFHLRSLASVNASSESQDKLLRSLSRFQGTQHQGSLFALDAKFREKQFAVERLNPNYSCAVKGIVQVQNNELTLNYQISCVPSDSSVDRVYVYFSSIDTKTTEDRWQWNIGGDASRLTARRLDSVEWSKLFSQHARRTSENHWPGECWELRLDNARSTPFEIRAELPVSLSEVFQIPLAALPLASTQKGEILIEASRLPNYQILNSRLQSIPVALPSWYRYQNIRAAFRYDPVEEFRQLSPSPLLFKRVAEGDIPPSAWVWMLRLDTQYENEGTVKNNAVFLLENRGKDSLRITLPTGIHTGNVHAVWLDDKRITWHPDLASGISDEGAATKEKSTKTLPNVVVVALPEGRRFVSVSLEYSSQGKNLTHHRHLTPRYPQADVPVLTGSWTSWLPPDFDVSTRFQNDSSDIENAGSVSRAVDYYLSSRYFNVFSLYSWKRLFYGKQYEEEASEASEIFMTWISTIFNESADPSGASSRSAGNMRETFDFSTSFPNDDKRLSDKTWSDLLRTQPLLHEMLISNEKLESLRNNRKSKLRKDGDRLTGNKIMIDRQAFNYYGITPTAPLTLHDTLQTRRHPAEILEQNGLVLLVSPKMNEHGEQEYVFYITSFLMSAVQHQFGSQTIGNNIRFVSDERRLYPRNEYFEKSDNSNDWTTDIGTPQWISAEDWIREESPIMFPWTISAQISRLASVTPDWIAYEIPGTDDTSLYIVHRNTYRAYHFLAFLVVLCLTWKRPFSSPIILIPLMILFEVWARWSVPCYLGIPSGAFFGAACSLGFELIRSRAKTASGKLFRVRNSEIVPPILNRDESDESVEVRTADNPADRNRSSIDVQNEKQKTPEPSIKTEVFFSQFPDAKKTEPSKEHNPEQDTEFKNDSQSDVSSSDVSSSDGGVSLGFWFFITFLGLFGFGNISVVGAAEFPEKPRILQGIRNTSTRADSKSIDETDLPAVDGLPDQNGFIPDGNSKTSVLSVPITPPRREPYRVFYPTDETQKIENDFVWLPEPFFRWLSKNIQPVSPKAKRLWSIEKAEYEATLNSSLSQGLTVSEFKAVFHIILEENNTMIALPSMPIVSDAATWNMTPIQPVWQIKEKQSDAMAEWEKNRLLVFNLENERKGRHRLELTLDPKILKSDDIRRIAFEIPKVPDSVLKLNLPIDAPTIHVNDSLGTVSANSLASPSLKAEIGPSGKLAFHWTDEQSRSDNATVSVETMFRMKTRPLQIRAKFRYRVDGGRIRYVNIRTDPRWQLSGQFHCEEQPIERTETYYDNEGGRSVSVPQNEVTRLVFKSPVSGTITIQASFMLRDFSGIGNIRMPLIHPLQAETIRSLLAVYDDPILDLQLPDEGLGSGFESLWYSGLQTDSRPIVARQPNTNGGNAVTGSSSDTEAPPLAVYDLEKTAPTWVLSIRAKKESPELSLKQSVYLDDGESRLIADAVFSSRQNVFQIPFTIDRFLQINTIELADSDGNPVECRWSDSLNYDPGQEERKLIVFPKQPLSGTFRATVTGHIVYKKNKEEPSNPSDTKYFVPLLTFQDTELISHDLELYRSSSVLTKIDVDEAFWSPSENVSVAPKSFNQPIPSGVWKERLKNLSVQNSNNIESKTRIPSFQITLNRPIVHGEIVTSLSRSATGNAWELTFDVLWNITQGELRSFRFQWDERCGSVHSVQPRIPMTLEQKNGRTQLLLSPTTPFTGKQHFRIKAMLNPVGNTISIPTIEPILENADSFRNNVYIVLPRDFAGIAIPWNLSNLTPVDAETVEYLKEQVDKKFKDEHHEFFPAPSSFSTAFLNSTPLPVGSTSLTGVEFPVKESITTAESLFYKAAGSDFTASIVHRNEKPVATLLDISYSIRNDGRLFGMMTIDLKSRGHDSCVLTMPPNFELIQLISAGISSSGSRLMDRRWKIELSSSDYPQRISVVFRGSLEYSDEKEKKPRGESNYFSLRKLKDGRWTTPLPLPTLENVDINETLWTLSFESSENEKRPLLSVATVREKIVVPDDPVLPFQKQEITEFLGNRYPAVGQEASETLIKLDLVRLNNLLASLDAITKPIPAIKLDEVARWEAQWSKEWNGLLKMIDYQRLAFPQAIYASDHQVLLDPLEKQKSSGGGQNIQIFLDSMKPTEMSLRALMIRKENLIGEMNLPPSSGSSEDRSRQLSTTFLVHYPSRINERSSHLFGATEGSLKEIRIESVPIAANWAGNFVKFSILWILIPLALILFFRKLPFTDIVVQFPHFWGAIVGLLLWSLFPAGLLGGCILVLVFLSLWYSPWLHREIVSDKNRLT